MRISDWISDVCSSDLGTGAPLPSFTSLSSLGTAGTSLLVQSLGGLIGNRILPFADSFRIDPGQVETLRPTVTFEKQISRDVPVVVTFSQEDQKRMEKRQLGNACVSKCRS